MAGAAAAAYHDGYDCACGGDDDDVGDGDAVVDDDDDDDGDDDDDVADDDCALFHVIFRTRFIVSLRLSFLPGPGLGVLLSSYHEGALYKFHR